MLLSKRKLPQPHFDFKLNKEVVKLQPGEYYATEKDIAMMTILGSCVSCCLFDAENKIGGMNHFLLPAEDGGVLSASARYGAHAMELLVNALLKLGAEKKNLIAKAFGGGHVLTAIKGANIGRRNVEFIQRYLQEENIPLDKADLGGTHARKICFFPLTGQALVKKLPPVAAEEPLQEEVAYQKKLRVKQDIELF